jgi:serine/threonine-protein kinase
MEEPTHSAAGSRVGSRFGRYQIRRLLGNGGFGEVYEAEDTEMDRVVALKLLAAPYSQDTVFRQRLFREARTAGRLHEPHVVPIHHCGEIDGQLYIDMRLIEGTDLQTVLAREGQLRPARSVAILRQIAAALDAAHGAQMVHRDVKPGNILLTGDDFACLVDFGLAHAATDAKLTGSGTTIGTFAYMSPERLNNAEVNHRADIYALACVLYDCLTGAPPYSAADLHALITAHLTAPIPRPSQHRPQIPASFDDVIAGGMAKNAKDRYASAGELARAAHDALSAQDQSQADTILATTQAAANGGRGPIAAKLWPIYDTFSRTLRAASSPSKIAVSNRSPGHRKTIRLAAVVVPIVLAVIVALLGYRLTHSATLSTPPPQPSSPPSQTSHNSQPPQQPAPPSLPSQVELPFLAGANYAHGLAVDSDDNLYISDGPNMRVGKLSAGSTVPVALPFTGLHHNQGVAVDAAGNVYVADTLNDRVLKLPAGSNTQVELPFTGLQQPDSLAVDSDGNVYVTAWSTFMQRNQVLQLPAGSNTPVELATTLVDPKGVAVDSTDNVYVADKGSQVFKFAAGSTPPVELPFSGLNGPDGVAVDAAGNVYAADFTNNRVLKLPAGSTTQVTLPFTGLRHPVSVAVDTASNVYVSDIDDDARGTRVLKLAAATSTASAASPPVPTGVPTPSAIAFDDMQTFIARYYGQLPAHPLDAWTKLDAGYQQRTGLNDYLKYWSTVRSVTVLSVAPASTSRVVAHLQYVGNDGHLLTEDRWFQIVSVDGALLIGDSETVN